MNVIWLHASIHVCMWGSQIDITHDFHDLAVHQLFIFDFYFHIHHQILEPCLQCGFTHSSLPLLLLWLVFATAHQYLHTVQCTSSKYSMPIILNNSFWWLTEEAAVLSTAITKLLTCFAFPLVHLNWESVISYYHLFHVLFWELLNSLNFFTYWYDIII